MIPQRARHRRSIVALLALVALIAQVTVALAPLAEHLAGSMAAHVESQGAKGHFTHDESTCPACQARSITGTTVAVAIPALAAHRVLAVVVALVDRVPTGGQHSIEISRAPPVVS